MKKLVFLLIAAMVSVATLAQAGHHSTDTTKKAVYACPMHPEITGTAKDKCSKCGMALTEVKKYVCPMHPDVTANKKGKCSKCGMDLVEEKTTPKPKKG